MPRCHRGESVPAIQRAYEVYRYDGVEMDLRITGDGIPVLLHDDKIGSPDNSFVVSEHTFEELQEFTSDMLGSWQGEPVSVPSLEAALRANGDRGLFLADMRIASKHADRVKLAVEAAGFLIRNLEITTYSITHGQAFKQALPEAQVVVKQYAFPSEISRTWIDEMAAAGLDGVMLKMPENGESILEFTDYVHWKGLTLTTFVHYGKNTVEELQGLVEDRVDNILTVHSGYRELLAWPAPDPLPRLNIDLDRPSGRLRISWKPARPYAFRLQASDDAIHWENVRTDIDTSQAPKSLQITLPTSELRKFYRLAAQH